MLNVKKTNLKMHNQNEENEETLPPFMLGEPLPPLSPTNLCAVPLGPCCPTQTALARPHATHAATWPLGPTLLIRYVSLVTLGNAFIPSVS